MNRCFKVPGNALKKTNLIKNLLFKHFFQTLSEMTKHFFYVFIMYFREQST